MYVARASTGPDKPDMAAQANLDRPTAQGSESLPPAGYPG